MSAGWTVAGILAGWVVIGIPTAIGLGMAIKLRDKRDPLDEHVATLPDLSEDS